MGGMWLDVESRGQWCCLVPSEPAVACSPLGLGSIAFSFFLSFFLLLSASLVVAALGLDAGVDLVVAVN